MLSKRSTLALTATVALLSVSCSVSRQASSSHSEQLRVESLGFRDSSDVERVEVHDTITITRTITVQTNDKGDTLRVNTETDRERIRSKADVRRQKVETKVIRDTVYIEQRDSVLVQEFQGSSVQGSRASPLSYLKWAFWLVVAVTVLIVVIRLRR